MKQFRRPLVVALTTFLLGLLAALATTPPLSLVLLAFLGALLLTIFGSRQYPGGEPGWFAIGPLFLAAGALVGAAEQVRLREDCRASFTDGELLVVSGRLAAAHRPAGAGGRTPLLPLLNASPSGRQACNVELRVRLPADHLGLDPGTALTLHGRWRTFDPPVIRSAWPRDPRFLGFLIADSATVAPDTDRPPLHLAARARADAALESLFPRELEMMEALVLGRREYVDPIVRDRYARAGLAHLLAISGMHVGLLAGACLLLCTTARIPRRQAMVVTLAATWGYLLVIGAAPSALRAGTMISLALIATLLQRPAAAAPIMAAAALLLIWLNPIVVLDPGFQLSFAGVLGILVLRAPLLTLAPDQLLGRSRLRGTVEAFAVGVAASLVTAPIVAHHFGIVAPVSFFSGVPAVPLMSLALIGAMAALLVLPFAPPVAQLIADGAGAALALLDWLAAVSADLPYASAPVPPPPWWSWLLASAAAVAAARAGARLRKPFRWLVMGGAALAVLTLWPVAVRAGTTGVEVHFIDVGQGDATAIRTPRRRWVVVDAGPASAGFDAGQQRVLPFLSAHGARSIEALVLTHPDLDHIGGAGALLRGVNVANVFEPGAAVGRDPYFALLAGLDSTDATWRAARSGRSMTIDGVRFDFLWPDAETVDVTGDANQISAVVRVVFGEFSLLLTGDVGVEVEERLVERHGVALRADVLKLGHHGSSTSTSERLLDAVRPGLAVVSAGRSNRYGHPAPAVVRRVEARAIAIARTDREGTISLRVNRDGTRWAREEW